MPRGQWHNFYAGGHRFLGGAIRRRNNRIPVAAGVEGSGGIIY